MPRIVIVILIYCRHKPMDLAYLSSSVILKFRIKQNKEFLTEGRKGADLCMPKCRNIKAEWGVCAH
jgi:hypothetical protein